MIDLLLDKRLGTIEPELFGCLIENYGTLLDGIWVGDDPDIPNDDGLRLDTIEALRELGISVIRFPGGTTLSASSAGVYGRALICDCLMNETQKCIFDLNGYIVVEGVLSAAEVARCNEAIDRHADAIVERTGELSLSGDSTTLKGSTGRGDLGGLLGWDKPWCQPFREMLAHPRVVPYLNTIVGPGYRLDHNAGLISMRTGAEGHTLHGSSGPGFDPHQYYIFKDGRMHNGLTVASWQLTDVNPGDGGLCLIPGSHKCKGRRRCSPI